MRNLLVIGLMSTLAFGITCVSAKEWEGDKRMSRKVVYGSDNRMDPVDSVNEMMVRLSRSTAAQIKASRLSGPKGTDFYEIPDISLAESFKVCPDQRFAKQNAISRCSGSLVGPDLIVTAGHCVDQKACESGKFKWVFGYRKENIADLAVEASDVYGCREVLNRGFNEQTKSDFALIRLDRKVEDREPLKFRRQGKIKNGTPLAVIGHPSGLPTKIASGANVLKNNKDFFFETNLDTFGGNSGSAVFNSETGVVEGVLVRGAKDYRVRLAGLEFLRRGAEREQGESKAGLCRVVNQCDGVGGRGCGGEEVTRIRKVEIQKYLD